MHDWWVVGWRRKNEGAKDVNPSNSTFSLQRNKKVLTKIKCPFQEQTMNKP